MINLMNIGKHLSGYWNGRAYSGEQLSARFEKMAALTGIAASYKFPKNRTATEFDHWAHSFCSWRDGDSESEKEHLKDVWNDLVRLNPELETIETYDTHCFLRNAIFGSASQFNPDDIKFFIEMQKRTHCSHVALLVHEDQEYVRLCRDITVRTGVEMEWVASPQTLLSIYSQVKDRAEIAAYTDPMFGNVSDADVRPEHISAARNFINLIGKIAP